MRQVRPEGGLNMGKPRTEYYKISPREAVQLWETLALRLLTIQVFCCTNEG